MYPFTSVSRGLLDPIGTPRRNEATLQPSEQVEPEQSVDSNTLRSAFGPSPSADRYVANGGSLSSANVDRASFITIDQQLQTAQAAVLAQEADIRILQQRLQAAQNQSRSETYVAVLINGNDLVPAKAVLCLAADGGRKLAEYIANHAAERVLARSAATMVTTRIFANVQDMAFGCAQVGAVPSVATYLDFASGFNRYNAVTDFVDMGPINSHCEERMIIQFSHYLGDLNCRHILLGCRPYNDLTKFLAEHMMDPQIVSRVTLIGGFEDYPTLPQYRRERFDDLFLGSIHRMTSMQNPKNARDAAHAELVSEPRTSEPQLHTTEVSEFVPYADGVHQVDPVAKKENVSGNQSAVDSGSTASSNIQRGGNLSASSPELAGEERSGLDSKPNAWSQVVRRAAHLPFRDLAKSTDVTVKKRSTGAKMLLFNAEGRRLDEPMDYDAQKIVELKQKKYCNQHYIGKGCCHWNFGNDNCPHYHEAKLTAEDLKWLRVVARETVCKKGVFCADPDCIYGHQCPYPKRHDGAVCVNGDQCRFKSMHGMDTVIAKRVPVDEGRRRK